MEFKHFQGRKVIIILSHGFAGSTGIILGDSKHGNIWNGGPLGVRSCVNRVLIKIEKTADMGKEGSFSRRYRICAWFILGRAF